MSNTPYQTTDALVTVQGTANSQLGFYGVAGATGPVTITGAKSATGATGALGNLLTALAATGLIKDSTT